MPDRIILHIDFDYFYAQVEETVHPESKGRPIVVCMYSGRTETSGAVATCNYEARKYGVRSGIPIARAKRLLKGINPLFLAANHQLYSEISYKAATLLEKYGDKSGQASIDEFFLDVGSKCGGDYRVARALAEKIKQDIFEKLNLTCSAGIGPNKLIAKIASDFQKPAGLTVVKPDEVDAFLAYLDVDKIPGIGRKSREFLESMGIRTIADLRNHDPTDIVEKFGKNVGSWLVAASRGEDDSEVGVFEEQKQISRIKTLKQDSRDLDYITGEVDGLGIDLANTLKANALLCSAIGINAIDSGLRAYTRSKTVSRPTDDPGEIKTVVQELYRNLLGSTSVEFRRAGIKLEKLQSKSGQKTLGEF